ncbi:lytic transglycosylase domain-containing protein [Desulfobulbus alkaliphilus]|uniref:lytic transglycosylase domain-containing protein n=1 Tax=Desulfobulbus alkaliphilus TaxID=869814 RepID=UPI0019656DED|nr:lytic transglycosylase domain-containing protein [Desulfobulbus alkaliphilus]MBM9537334.1 transglycosylase SLT domain-containing protein [Desulfobulbus alkaliphilus]
MVLSLCRAGHKRSLSILFLTFWLHLAVTCSPAFSSAGELFPLYPSIRPNVQFWENIYGKYTTNQGVMHDRNHLDRVYTVVELVPRQVPGAARINSERIKTARQQIDTILLQLGNGTPPQTRQERHIASLFPSRNQAAYLEARGNVRMQVGQKDRFHRGVVRSGRYLPQFKQIFAAHGLPLELLNLPHVESSYNYTAYSKAGAAGLWQFIRTTGSEYMTINDHVDERLDPYISTQAAARLLKTNYEQLKTWPLAITAYNYGRAGTVRAVRAKGCYENIFKSYDQGHFKFASRNFYSEFLAAMRVSRQLYADPNIRLDRPDATVTFRLQQSVPISRIHTTFNISQQELTRLNPALRKPVLDGVQPLPQNYLLRLPAGLAAIQPAATKVRKTVSTPPPTVTQVPASMPTRSIPVRYIVQPGDTTSSIARHFEVPLHELLAVNGRQEKNLIRVGESLIIPSRVQVVTLYKPEHKRKP